MKADIEVVDRGELVSVVEDIKHWNIPRQFMKPILPGPRHVTGDIIDALPNGAPDVSPHRYLLDCSESEERIKATRPRFYEYLQTGKVQKIHEAYLSTYMGGKHPFRFIWNRSQATAHNVYLMFYPIGPLRAALNKHPEFHVHVFEALQRVTPAQLVSGGRVYGGGLHKAEPKELAQIPARMVLENIQAYVRIEEQMPMLFT